MSDSIDDADVTAKIVVLRGCRVILDSDLAALYGVPNKRLKEQVRRNAERFPKDFAFPVSNQEVTVSRSQIATLNRRRGHNIKHQALAFTEHGAIMAAAILNSPRAVQMSLYVVRAFVNLRRAIAEHSQLARELNALKQSVAALDADTKRQFDIVHEAILGLMALPPKKH